MMRCTCALLLLALPACDSTSEPEGLEGRYRAHTVNGMDLPVAVWGNWVNGSMQVTDAAVRLEANGQGSVEVATRMMAPDSTVGTVKRTTYSGAFQQNGDLLTFAGLLQSSEGQQRVRAEGVVLSRREVVVTLHVPSSSYQGYFVYPISIIARR
jgi:hypothetical protein